MVSNPGTPNTDDYIRTEVPHWCDITIWHAEDFYEAVPQMIDGRNGLPLNLDSFADLRFDLFIRSSFEFATDIAFLTSAGNDGIFFDDRPNGMISLQRDRSVIDDWPAGQWVHFLNMNWTESSVAVTKTIWRGAFIIRPGKAILAA